MFLLGLFGVPAAGERAPSRGVQGQRSQMQESVDSGQENVQRLKERPPGQDTGLHGRLRVPWTGETSVPLCPSLRSRVFT